MTTYTIYRIEADGVTQTKVQTYTEAMAPAETLGGTIDALQFATGLQHFSVPDPDTNQS